MANEIAYTINGPIVIPDVKFKEVPSHCTTMLLRGYEYVIAVVEKDNENNCLGWAVKPNPII